MHPIDEASRAVLVPANRFEVLECRVAIDAVNENVQDTRRSAPVRWTRFWRSTCLAALAANRFSQISSMKKC